MGKWKNDVPASLWERLMDWGYTCKTSNKGLAVYAGNQMLRLIDSKDEYYQEMSTDELSVIYTDVCQFLNKHRKYKGVGLR